MTSLKRLLRIKTLLLSTLYLLMTQVVVGQSPAASVKAGASFKEAGQVREKGEVNAASALFGPWGDAASLRAAIIDRLKRQIDEEPYHQTEADIMLGITIAEAKGRAKEYIEKEDCLLAREAFEKVSAGLAKVLNGWLREQIFSPQDFLPIDDDFPKGATSIRITL